MLRIHRPEAHRGSDRERRQLEAWLFGCSQELFASLGLPDGWWCGINLDRRDIFADGSSGDVDVIAGPTRYVFSSREWQERTREAESKHGSQFGLAMAHVEAAKAGLVQWPPEVGYTAVVEVKASYFDEEWRATHVAEDKKILGSLRRRVEYGANRVAYFHLGAVASCVDADTMDARADLAASKFPLVLDPRKLGSIGYGTAIMNSVVRDDAAIWGRLDGVTWWNPPELVNPIVVRPWHERLRTLLARLPPPRSSRTFIHYCPYCEGLMHAGSANPDGFSCGCTLENRLTTWNAAQHP